MALYQHAETDVWKKTHNEKQNELFQRSDIIKEIPKRRLNWVGHACRKQGSLVRTAIKEMSIGKRPLGRPRLRWEDCIKRDVKKVEPDFVVEEMAVIDMVKWRDICLAVSSQRPGKLKKMTIFLILRIIY